MPKKKNSRKKRSPGKKSKSPATAYAVDEKGRQEIGERFLAGESRASLAQAFKVSAPTISSYLKKLGISADMRKGTGPGSRGGRPPADTRGDVGDREKHREAHLAIYSELESPPTDPLEGMAWLRHVYLLQLKFITEDRNYPGSEQQRRKEILDIGRAATACRDEAALAAARRIVLDRQKRKKNKRRGGAEVRANAAGLNGSSSVRVPGRAGGS